MMERLTIDEIIEHCDNKIYLYEKVGRNIDFETEELTEAIKDYWEHKQVKNYLDELMEYRQLEEQGLLLRLPCKVGDTVYVINGRYTKCTQEGEEFDEYSCQGCECLECDSHKEYYIHTNKAVSLEWIVRYSKEIGKTVFLTQAEAEQKLKEMESD